MKQKKAFSLIEVLLVTAIIAIVTAMGFSISKSGMEKAYNLYWYTGYSTLNDVTYDAKEKGKLVLNNFDLCKYFEHLERMVIHPANNYEEGNCNEDEYVTLTAANGIKYTIYKQEQDANGNDYDFIRINMDVPHAKKEGSKTHTTFILPLQDSDLLDKLNPQICVYPASDSYSSDPGYLGLQNRADLLPFYIKLPNQNTGIKNFYSFKTAFCTLHGNNNKYLANTAAEIDCSAYTGTSTGSLRHISPRKAY